MARTKEDGCLVKGEDLPGGQGYGREFNGVDATPAPVFAQIQPSWTFPLPSFVIRNYTCHGGQVSREQAAFLFREILSVTRGCVDKVPDYGVFRLQEENFSGRSITLIYPRRSPEPIAFSAVLIVPYRDGEQTLPVYHTGIAMVTETQRGRGILNMLYALPFFRFCLARRFKGFYVTSVSQVPAAVGIIADTIGHVYPHYKTSGTPSDKQLSVARWMLAHYRTQFGTGDDASFDERTFIIHNSFTGGSESLKKAYADCQKYRDERCNALCLNMLDYERGDEFLQVGWVDSKTLMLAGRRVLRSIVGW